MQIDAFVEEPALEAFKLGTPLQGGERVHKLVFPLTPENAPTLWRWRALAAEGVRIRLDGAATSDQLLNYVLIHPGRVIVRSPEDKMMRFTHPSRKYGVAYHLPDGSSLEEEKLLVSDPSVIHLSPFTSWTLVILESSNPGLDLRGVATMRFGVWGTYLA